MAIRENLELKCREVKYSCVQKCSREMLITHGSKRVIFARSRGTRPFRISKGIVKQNVLIDVVWRMPTEKERRRDSGICVDKSEQDESNTKSK